MNRSTALAVCLALIGISSLYSAILYPHLPNPTPSHWDAEGHIDGYSSPLWVCLLVPAMMVGFLLLFMALPKMSPEKFKVDSWARVYNLIMALVMLLFGVIHFMTISASRQSAVLSPKFLFAVLFVFWALMGNFVGKVRRNFWVGVRTPWTLSSETVWNIVHRRAGQLWVATGILGATLTLLGLPFWYSFGLLIVSAFVPVIHSYFVWKRVENGRA